MTNFKATMIAEGVDEASAEETLEAWAHLIKTGLAWTLQGWFGRTASSFIDEGYITDKGIITEKGHIAIS